MSRACRLLMLAALALSLAGCGSSEWKTFSPSDADWQVEAPGGNLVRGLDEASQDEKAGNRSQYSNFEFVEGRHQSFLLGEFPLDASAKDLSVADIIRQQIAERCADLGSPIATREVSNGSLTGGEVDWTSGSGFQRIRFLVTPDRGKVLIATVVIRGEETPARAEIAARFLGSVRLKDDAAATSPTPSDSSAGSPSESVTSSDPAPSGAPETTETPSTETPASPTPDPSAPPEKSAPSGSPESQAIARLEAKGAQVFRGAGADGNSATRVLVFSKAEFDDAACRDLAELSEVQELMIEGTSVTDAGIGALAGLKKVSRMSLRNSAVGDAGLAALHPLSTLRFLDLTGTQVSPDGVAALKTAIAGIDVTAPAPAVAAAPAQDPGGTGPQAAPNTGDPAQNPAGPGPQDPQQPEKPRPIPIVPGSPEYAVQQVVMKGASGELEGVAAVIDPVAPGLIGQMRDGEVSATRKAHMMELFGGVRLVSNFEARGGRVIVLVNSLGQPLSFTCMQGDDRNYRVTELFVGPIPGRRK